MLKAREISSGNRSKLQMTNFREALSDCILSDLEYSGNPFTFPNKRQGQDESKARLDRSVASPDLRLAFPNVRVFHLSSIRSDHCPVLTDLHFMRGKKASKFFRFEPMWFRNGEFKEYVTRTLNQLSTQDTNLHSHLLNLSSALTQLNKTSFGDVRCKIKLLKQELKNLTNVPRTSNTVSKEATLIQEIDEWLLREEILWKQRVKTDWMREGN